MASHLKSRAFFRPTHGAKPNSSAPISHLSLKRNKYLLGEVSPYSAYNHLFMVKRETFNRFPPIRRRTFTLHLFIYGTCYTHGGSSDSTNDTSPAHEPCKCRSRAVQVLFTSRASVVHEPCKCYTETVRMSHMQKKLIEKYILILTSRKKRATFVLQKRRMPTIGH